MYEKYKIIYKFSVHHDIELTPNFIEWSEKFNYNISCAIKEMLENSYKINVIQVIGNDTLFCINNYNKLSKYMSYEIKFEVIFENFTRDYIKINNIYNTDHWTFTDFESLFCLKYVDKSIINKIKGSKLVMYNK